MLVGSLTVGDVFGEMGILGRVPHTASVRARSEVKVGVINKKSLLMEFEKLPKNVHSVSLALVNRLQITTEKLAKLTVQIHQLKSYTDSLAQRTEDTDTIWRPEGFIGTAPRWAS